MLVRLENVQKHYKQFDLNCSLEVQPGCITGLIGQNGSGKTTTFKSILGLIKTEGGSIEILGKNPRELDTEDKKKIGVVLSDSGFSEYMTVKDLITVMEKLYEKFDRQGFEEKCRKFQIPGNKRMKEFSTGMKAKIKLLVAISHQAEFLLLDEPTAGLDPQGRESILENIRAYQKAKHATVMMVSHAMEEVARMTDRLLVMDHGGLRMDNSPREVFRHAWELQQIGLAIPQVTRVFLRLRELGVPVDSSVYTVEQAVQELLRLKGGKASC